MEKLQHVVRLRMTDEMKSDIQRFMRMDDRDRFDEACRHLLRLGLDFKLRLLESNGQGVERRGQRLTGSSWSGPERRKVR